MLAPITEPDDEQLHKLLTEGAHFVVAMMEILGGIPQGLHTVSFSFRVVNKEPLAIIVSEFNLNPENQGEVH